MVLYSCVHMYERDPHGDPDHDHDPDTGTKFFSRHAYVPTTY